MNYNQETDNLTMLLFTQMEAYLEDKYGADGLPLCVAIVNGLTIRPTENSESIQFERNNQALIEEAVIYLQQFDGIKDTFSLLVDTLNEQRSLLGEQSTAAACLAKAKKSGLYVHDSYGKSLLKQAQQQEHSDTPGTKGCLGIVLFAIGLVLSLVFVTAQVNTFLFH